MKKTIALVSNEHNWTYKLRKEIIQALLDSGYHVVLLLPYGEKVELLKQMGCDFIHVPYFDRRGKNPLVEIKLMRFYRKTLRQLRPDLVLTYTIKPNTYCGAVCASLKIPYIANITGLGSATEKKGLLKTVALLLYRVGLRKANVVFFQNKNNYRFMSEHHLVTDNYSLLPGSGVNLEDNRCEPYPSEENGLRFLFVGRIMKAKGMDEYLYCAKAIHQKHPNTTFDIIGNFEESAYQAVFERYEAEGFLHYLGFQSDVHSYMQSHHVVIQPSCYGEGLSNVLLEAAACGRPIIASDIPGCIEAVDEGINGFSFAPKNGNSLVAAAEKLLALSAEERAQMGLCGRKKMENEFDRQIVADAYLREIKKIFQE